MTRVDGIFDRVVNRVQQTVCGLSGHDSLLHFDNGRMSLLCSSCGHESPGWDVKDSGTAAAAVQGKAPVRVPLVHARKAA